MITNVYWGSLTIESSCFLCSVGTEVANRIPTTNQEKGRRGTSMLPVCAYRTSDHTLTGWYLKGFG